jgi:Flp pilus assembly protein TadB
MLNLRLKRAQLRAYLAHADERRDDRRPDIGFGRSRTRRVEADTRRMKRRLTARDRLAWLVALVAVGAVLYLVLPLWALVTAIVVGVVVPVVLRGRRRERARR